MKTMKIGFFLIIGFFAFGCKNKNNGLQKEANPNIPAFDTTKYRRQFKDVEVFLKNGKYLYLSHFSSLLESILISNKEYEYHYVQATEVFKIVNSELYKNNEKLGEVYKIRVGASDILINPDYRYEITSKDDNFLSLRLITNKSNFSFDYLHWELEDISHLSIYTRDTFRCLIQRTNIIGSNFMEFVVLSDIQSSVLKFLEGSNIKIVRNKASSESDNLNNREVEGFLRFYNTENVNSKSQVGEYFYSGFEFHVIRIHPESQ